MRSRPLASAPGPTTGFARSFVGGSLYGIPVDFYWMGDTDTVPTKPANWSRASGGGDASRIPDANDPTLFDAAGNNALTLAADLEVGSVDIAAGYTSKVDLANGAYTLTVNGNFTAAMGAAGEFDCGDATIVIKNGDFDNEAADTWTADSSTVEFQGACGWTGGATNDLWNVTIAVGAAVTVTSSGAAVDVNGTVAVNGELSVATGKALANKDTATTTVGAAGKITGLGTYRIAEPGAAEGLTVFTSGGVIDVAEFLILKPNIAAVMAVGTYSSAITRFKNNAAAAHTMTLSATPGIPYTISGDWTFENTDAGGTLTVANDTNDPDIVLQADVVWTETAGTITYTAGTGDMTFSGASDQDLDFGGSAVEPFTIDKSAGEISFESGTFVMAGNSGCFDFTCSGDADVDLADSAYTLTLADGGDFLADGSGTFDCGDSTISLTNGDFDNSGQTVWTYATSTLVMAGVGTLTGSTTNDLYNLTIAAGAVITVNSDSDVVGAVIVNGALSLSNVLYCRAGATLAIGAAGSIAGASILFFVDPGAGEGITSFAAGGSITVAEVWVLRPNVAAVIAVGIYGAGLFRIYNTAAAGYTLTLSATPSIPYTITGDLEFENTDAGGSLEIANDSNDPDIVLQGDVVWTETAGIITYTKGTGSLTASGGSNQDWDFDSSAIEDLIIDKSAGYLLLSVSCDPDSITQTAGELQVTNGEGLTVAGNAVFNDDVTGVAGVGVDFDLAVTGTNVAHDATITGVNATVTPLDATDNCVNGGNNTNVTF